MLSCIIRFLSPLTLLNKLNSIFITKSKIHEFYGLNNNKKTFINVIMSNLITNQIQRNIVKNNVIKIIRKDNFNTDKIIRDIRILPESNKEDYYETVRIGNAFSSNYI